MNRKDVMLAPRNSPTKTSPPLASLSPAAEDFPKVAYKLGESEEAVSTTALADTLGVTAPSATQMSKRLAERRLVKRTPYKGTALTDAGARIALQVIRYHRLLELYLKTVMNYSWRALHEEAERLIRLAKEVVNPDAQ